MNCTLMIHRAMFTINTSFTCTYGNVYTQIHCAWCNAIKTTQCTCWIVQEQDSALYSLQVHLCIDNLTLINIKPICLIL